MNYLLNQLNELCKNTNNNISLLANASALLNEYFTNINWVGFYLYSGGKLVLGPFQGKVACTEIPIGKGVCGTAFKKKLLTNVSDVHMFAGHIACDAASNSEIVVPLIYEGKRFGVLDIDSPVYSRFNDEDEIILEEVAKIISKYLYENKK